MRKKSMVENTARMPAIISSTADLQIIKTSPRAIHNTDDNKKSAFIRLKKSIIGFPPSAN